MLVKNRHLLLIVTLGFLIVSCSEKSSREGAKRENSKEPRVESADGEGKEKSPSEADEDSEHPESELAPEVEDIGEDCVAFLRATKAIAPGEKAKDCPACPAPGSTVDVLQFQNFEIERTTPSKDGCTVEVKIHAKFNPSIGGKIFGGLVGWIPLEQREQYAHGETPTGSQIYAVNITYRRPDGPWRAVEFAPGR